MANQFFSYLSSPLGSLLVTGDGTSLTGLYFEKFDGGDPPEPGSDWRENQRAFTDVAVQLGEYFSGKRTAFSLAIAPQGTPFQQRVWRELLNIPFGRTKSYGTLAREMGSPGAMRAVGAANGRNPIAIIIPCHRVIGSSGRLTGYGGGMERKKFLLELENAQPVLALR